MHQENAPIRLALPADAAAIAAIYAPVVEATTISFEEMPPDAAEMGARIEATLRYWPWLVFGDAGGVLGFAYASKHRERAAYRWAVDVSVYVGEGARGRGIGRALYEALFRILREQRFHRAHNRVGVELGRVEKVGRLIAVAPFLIRERVHGEVQEAGELERMPGLLPR